MAERERVIEVRNLKTAFGRTVIHEDLDLDVYRGEIFWNSWRFGRRKIRVAQYDVGITATSFWIGSSRRSGHL